MAIGQFLFIYLFMVLFIGEVYVQTNVYCNTYRKHIAMREGLLTDRAICRAQQYDYSALICLNGFKPHHFYCSTEGCNMFGHNCDGHCLTGDDFTYGETDFFLQCDIANETVQLCNYYLTNYKTMVHYSPYLQKLCPELLNFDLPILQNMFSTKLLKYNRTIVNSKKP